ncbi:MAG: dienelactone hydrolase family protein [Alphaproteobacteria bacterium]
MARLVRWLAILAVVALGLTLAQQPGPSDGLARLINLVTPAPAPGIVTETLRPDLSGGDPDPNPNYTPQGEFLRAEIAHGGKSRVWWRLSAPVARTDALTPAIVLLHGSGRDGRAMLEMWQAIGTQAVLIAPDALDPRLWNPAEDGPAFLNAVLDAAGADQPFDRQRVYLYGHSAGARFALYLAACTAGPWGAVAVHAGSLPGCTPLARNAAIPLLIQIGDQDPLFDLTAVRQSAASLAKAGHRVDLAVIPDHGHWLYDVGPVLAANAWAFFTRPD